MDDPWDVKSVRQSTQYVSCMKINGVPLLPPILSKECRKEMQYYKLLALEVEKRISFLKPLIKVIESDLEDGTDAPEISEQSETTPRAIEKVPMLNFDKTLTEHNDDKNCKEIGKLDSPKLVIDLSLSINKSSMFDTERRPSQQSSPIRELPERDCNCIKETKTANDEVDQKIANIIDDVHFSINIENGINQTNQKESPSLASKSFTGSLIDIHSESLKEKHAPQLVRQRSYTVLNPSPQLLAHLEVQSISTGIDVTSISMSESMSNLSITPGKKRRSWDLESAKSKWSSMAVELNNNPITTPRSNRPSVRKSATQPIPRARSLDPEKKRQLTATPKTWPLKSETRKPLAPHNQTVTKETTQPDSCNSRIPQMTPKTPKSENLDPAARIRELYERIQNQQLLQMAHLVEKQKKEQQLLQQVFEEQNNLFYKQLKTIAPKETIEVKEAWGEREDKPVSLSQLIHHTPKSDLKSTLNDTKNYINQCEDVLKKSRDITTSLIKETKPKVKGNITRTQSPVGRTRSTPRRKIVYESSSSDREYEPILTDRTNDTMADLNVTFSTDESGNEPFYSNNTVVNNINNITVVKTCALPNGILCDDMPVNMPHLERMSQNICMKNGRSYNCDVTERERSAASIIVAHAKGYLTRRLMRTEKVEGTVQTIKDALLCALQLHQDREGIRGADVDLHRRLIQQITAACYSLHDTLVASTPSQRCALIAADRARKLARTRNSSARSSFSRSSPARYSVNRNTNIMSASYPAPPRRRPSPLPSTMTQSNYETYSESKSPISSSARYSSPRRRPWR